MTVVDRDRVDAGQLGAALLWAVARVNRDSLRLDTLALDLRLGSPAVRRALIQGADPNRVAAGEVDAARAFETRTRRYWLYH
jgi:hypothetical protein